MFFCFFIGEGVSPLTVDNKAQSFTVEKHLGIALNQLGNWLVAAGQAEISGRAGGAGLVLGARLWGWGSQLCSCHLLWDLGRNGMIPQWEYPRPFLAIWDRAGMWGGGSEQHPQLGCRAVDAA